MYLPSCQGESFVVGRTGGAGKEEISKDYYPYPRHETHDNSEEVWQENGDYEIKSM